MGGLKTKERWVAVLVARLLARGSFLGSKPDICSKAINERHCKGLANAI
jgi:hypothetical protein